MNNKKFDIIWLDDSRNPNAPYMGDCEESWIEVYVNNYFPELIGGYSFVWIDNSTEFKSYIEQIGVPYAICFDHDLGMNSEDGAECARWLVNYCLDRNIPCPKFAIQSSNPVGAENIRSLINNYNKHFDS